jgi:hypothetical protein
MISRRFALATASTLLAAMLPGLTAAQAPSTKDIVLDQINRPQASPAGAPASDAMLVSVLLESLDGSLTPRPTNARFKTGDRFRVRVLAARDGKIALYNTRPNGQLVPEPVWQGTVKRGLELVTPRLRLDGQKGTDQLHVVLEPAVATGITAWLTGLLKTTGKDIWLDTQNTASTTYLRSEAGKGLVTTLRIAHG